MAAADLSVILPRVLIVSRRSVRKNKFVDFVGMDLVDFNSFINFQICRSHTPFVCSLNKSINLLNLV